MSSLNFQVKKDLATINKTVITNIIKMLAYRGWVNKTNVDNLISSISSSNKDNKIYSVKLDVDLTDFETYEPFENKKEWKKFVPNTLVIFIYNQKITGKSQAISDFINIYSNYHKIIVIDSITDKIKQTLTSAKLIEIFVEPEFMMNITEHVCCPEFQVLNNKELDEINESYGVKKKEMNKQYDSDPMSRYLFLRRGQGIRVVRNNYLTGQSVNYRIITHKALQK